MKNATQLYLITPSPFTDQTLVDVAAALAAGVDWLQFRGKDLSDEDARRYALELRALCRQHQTLLFINDRIDLALAVDADGVHLGQHDGSIADARRQLGHRKLGVTCHGDIELARRAVEQGADYVAFGRCFPSRTKPEAPPCELSVFAKARDEFSVPIVAIGGITPDNGDQVLAAGADTLAVIDGVFGQHDIATAVKRFHRLLGRA